MPDTPETPLQPLSTASAMEVDLNALKQSRTALRRSLTAMKTKIEKETTIDATILECRLQILESYFKQLSHIQTQIERVIENDNIRVDIEETYVLTKSLIVNKLKSVRHEPNFDATMLNQSRCELSLSRRLPNLKLPTFSGKYSEYKRFISTFNNFVHNEPIPIIDKFNYLLNCLSDQALAAVEAFQVTEQNYNKALERLAERFDNKVLILKEHISNIFEIPSLLKPDALALRKLIDSVAALRGSLLSLGTADEILNAILIHLVVSKLDTDSRNQFNEKQDLKDFPTWDECYTVLSRRCQLLQDNATSVEPSKTLKFSHKQHNQSRKSTFVATNSESNCSYCNRSDHYIGNCPSFHLRSPSNRFEAVKQRSLCINCLRSGHFSTKCTSKSRCKRCRSLHHTLLHFESPSQLPTGTEPTTTQSSSHTKSMPVALLSRTAKRAFIPTAIVLIKDQAGVYHPIRTLLDSCSELNFITEEAAKRLKLKWQYNEQEVSGIADVRTTISRFVNATVRSRINEFEWTSSFAVATTISSNQPGELVDIQKWNIPYNIDLADPKFYKPQHVDLLIGAEVFFDLLRSDRISLGHGLPTLVNSVFGWIVGGSFLQGNAQNPFTCNIAMKSHDLNCILKRFWEIEEFPPQQSKGSSEDDIAESHFIENTKRCDDGRIMVRLPFKITPDVLGQSFEIARKRFLSLERRLQRDPSLKESYRDFMQEYTELGHMSEIKSTSISEPHFYIPHHCVLKPESTTTKLRVVFDASAKSSSGLSLNDTLHVGPTIQQDLIITLLTFRLNKYALTADVSKMFRQFLVDERDRKFQLILWRDEPHQNIRTFSLNTVTYGLASAPFQAVRCLFYIADHCKEKFPVASSLLKEDFYVDDMLAGADTLEELQVKKTQISEALKLFGLSLSKWNSNHFIFRAKDNPQLHLNIDQSPYTKTLGTIWNVVDDTFNFNLPAVNITSPTKRSVLSAIARIFDVLGLLSPIIIRLKILLQEMWICQVGWDDNLPPNLLSMWSQVQDDMLNINKISIPRYVYTNSLNKVQIHGFADASQRAYGCCIYIRAVVDDQVKVSLLIAKSKIAPVKAQSLPRLELCAALLLTTTWNKIRHKVNKFVNFICFWSDSQIVLHWLKMHSSALNCFVANRISEIQTLSNDIPWKHVPSKQNPADIVSRGTSAEELPNTIWFSGPEFLYRDKSHWPQTIEADIAIDETLINTERLKTVTFKCSSSGSKEWIINKLVNKFSSFMKILRIMSYIYRVFNKTPPIRSLKSAEISLNSTEIENTFWIIVHFVQNQCFKEDIFKIAEKKEVSPSLRNLTPFLHNMDLNNQTYPILRVGGRLLRAPIAFDARFPALLPKQHRFTQLYVEHLHRQHLHAGPKALIGILRQKVWIVNARELIRKVVRQCVHCFHYQPKLQQQIMGNLPSDRLKAQRPFLVTGLDFCGPFLTSYRIRSKQPYKTYLAVFICFTSRAVHFELVSDLSTNAFLLSLKRFIGRRGMPHKIYCDNATNFVGARTALLELQQRFFNNASIEEIATYSHAMGFEFCFIPPRAPHFGGFWEAAVKSAKSLLIKNIGQAYLSWEELQTVVIEAEAILNSRPICPLTDNPNDGEALTPGHLLIGTSLLCPPERHIEDNQIKYLTRYQRIAYFKQQFWELWKRDYLHQLQQKTKWVKPTANTIKDQLAFIHEDNTPPQLWLLGRIIATYPAADGHVRVVELKTKRGILKRPIHKIALLPLSLSPQGGQDVGGADY